MTPALSLTLDGMVRALSRLAERPAVDRALADRAEAIADAIDAAELAGVTTRVERRGPAYYAITATGLNGAARAGAVVAEAIARATRSAP